MGRARCTSCSQDARGNAGRGTPIGTGASARASRHFECGRIGDELSDLSSWNPPWSENQAMAFAAVFLTALVGYLSIFFLDEPAGHGFKGEHSVARSERSSDSYTITRTRYDPFNPYTTPPPVASSAAERGIRCAGTRPGQKSPGFRKRVSVAVGCGGEHHQREGGRRWRRDAIGLGNEFQRKGPATRCESRVRFGRQLLTGRHVEVMQKVCQEHDVVRAAPGNVEGTTRTAKHTARQHLPDEHSPLRPPAHWANPAR